MPRRTHGGVFYTGPAPKLPHFDERQPAQWDKKKEIAQEAVKLIENGDTVLLDGGSTTYEVARLLVGRPLQIVTNSLPVANLFAANANNDLVLIGGYVYPRTGVVRGPMRTKCSKGSASAARSLVFPESTSGGSSTTICYWSRPSGP